MDQFTFRHTGEPVAYPGHCALCTSDERPLLDTFADAAGGARIMLCPRCLKGILAVCDVVSLKELETIQRQLAAVGAQLRAATESLTEERRQVRDVRALLEAASGDVAALQSERSDHVASLHKLAEENRLLRADGARTSNDIVANLGTDAVASTQRRREVIQAVAAAVNNHGD